MQTEIKPLGSWNSLIFFANTFESWSYNITRTIVQHEEQISVSIEDIWSILKLSDPIVIQNWSDWAKQLHLLSFTMTQGETFQDKTTKIFPLKIFGSKKIEKTGDRIWVYKGFGHDLKIIFKNINPSLVEYYVGYNILYSPFWAF